MGPLVPGPVDGESVPAAPTQDPGAGGFAVAVTRLTLVHTIVLLAAVVSSPVLARTLGADGRGELAAILAVVTAIPWLLDLGLAVWVARERALGRSRADVLGAALPVALACSLLGVAAAIPLSHALGADRHVVEVFLQLGLFLSPLSVALWTLGGLVVGESRWGLYAAMRIVASVLPVVLIVMLAVLKQLTVGSAAAVYLLGLLLSGMLCLPLLRGIGRPSFDRMRMRAGAIFGARSWLTTISLTANVRLDQILMAGLVSSRELGLYAVAVSVGSVTLGMIGAVSSVLFPRVAQGDADLAARSCRVTTLIVGVAGALLAVMTPVLLPPVFGGEFDDAVPMALILLLASVPLAASTVLGSALVAAGNPAATMRAEMLALAATVPALILLLPQLGGRGAAMISLVAYTVKLVVQVFSACRTFERRWWSFLVPVRGDIAWLRLRVEQVVLRDRRTRGSVGADEREADQTDS